MKLRETTMKLSDKTLTLLKNFSTINQSILFKKGRSLRTISVMKNILAEATIDEDLPTDFGIYDLNQFLNGLGLHQHPDLDFGNQGHVLIREGKSPPDKEIKLASEDVSFELSTQQLDKLLKASAIYQLPDLAVVGEAGVVKLVVRDKKNDTSNDFSAVVGETDSEFSFNFKVENIKILPGTYDVVVSQKLLSRFTCQDYDLKYYIALEPDSTFGSV